MKDQERLLRKLPLAPVSENLDRRIEQLLATVPANASPNLLKRPILFWHALAMAAFGAIISFSIGWYISPESVQSDPTPVIYHVVNMPAAETARWLDWTQPPARQDLRDLLRSASPQLRQAPTEKGPYVNDAGTVAGSEKEI
ncbi:MAG: hypothetical protein HY706_10600 [Candidatus Hydrogenedentes bacterium]|nr:hypothetical protein [Candidatus Hydrogenedentota bacterium]